MPQYALFVEVLEFDFLDEVFSPRELQGFDERVGMTFLVDYQFFAPESGKQEDSL